MVGRQAVRRTVSEQAENYTDPYEVSGVTS